MAKDEYTIVSVVTPPLTVVPAKKPKILEKMRANPAGDWTISDVGTLCSHIGLELKPPSKGSHFKVKSDLVTNEILTIPARKPIKSIYIKLLVKLADDHIEKGGQT